MKLEDLKLFFPVSILIICIALFWLGLHLNNRAAGREIKMLKEEKQKLEEKHITTRKKLRDVKLALSGLRMKKLGGK